MSIALKVSLLSRTRVVNTDCEAIHSASGLPFLPPGALRRISVLGAGGYGTVRNTTKGISLWPVATCGDNSLVLQVSLCSFLTRAEHALMAVKTPDKGHEADLEREAFFYTLVDHPNVASCYGLLVYKGMTSLALQYCTGGSLAALAEQYNFQIPYIHILEILEQILSALEHLNTLGISHLDIKPANLLFDRLDFHAQIKLIDFGVSMRHGRCTSFPVHGTLQFMAPELFSPGATAAHANDIWSLGITLRFLCFGALPGQMESITALRSVLEHRLLHNDLETLPVHANIREIIAMCLQYDPAARPCATTLRMHVSGLLHDHRVQQEAAAARRVAEAALLNLPDTLGPVDSATRRHRDYALYCGVRLPVTLDL